MAYCIDLQSFSDQRGSLTVIERLLPFEIKRLYYIYHVDDSVRGKHRHKKTIQAAVSVCGYCKIHVQSEDGGDIETFHLDHPKKCVILQPEDFHWMDNFSPDCVLLVIASEFYDENDYIFTPYNRPI